MADVFLSYKREDRARAREIADGIERHGFEVFFDAEIDVGEAFDERIEREIAVAKCVVVLWSEKSATAKWVKREARVGAEREHLAPAIIGACTIPLEFSEVQAADLRAWRGDPAAPEWVQFINRVTECTQKPAKKLAARPWRRRWIRIAAGLIVGIGVAGGAAYLLRDRIFPPQVASTTATGTSTSTTTQASSTTLPSDVFQMLNWSIAAGDCDGLSQDIDAVRDEYPSVARVEQAMMRECRRRAPQVAQVAPSQQQQQQGKQASPPSQQQRPTQTTTATTQTAPPPAGFLARLRARDRAPVTDAQIAAIASRHGLSAAALGAVVDVEAGRVGGFAADGRPIILFEPHIFSRRTARRFDQSHPNVSYASWDASRYPRDQEGRWAQLNEAYALDPEAALASASWGRFQVMGMNFASAGFPSASEFVAFLAASEENQVEALARFIEANNLKDELERLDWEGFARGYNGSGQVERYGGLLRQAYGRRSQGG